MVFQEYSTGFLIQAELLLRKGDSTGVLIQAELLLRKGKDSGGIFSSKQSSYREYRALMIGIFPAKRSSYGEYGMKC